MELDIKISSASRSHNYIERTLESLYLMDPSTEGREVTVVIDGASDEYLGEWRKKSHVVTEVGNNGASYPGVCRSSANFLRAVVEGESSLLVFEDDVEFSQNWLARTISTCNKISAELGDDFVFSLYSTYKMRGTPKDYHPYSPVRFYGNQGLFIPARTRARMTKFLKKKLASRTAGHADMWVKDFLLNNGCPLLTAKTSMVQHIGEHSGWGIRFHTSPTFKRQDPDSSVIVRETDLVIRPKPRKPKPKPPAAKPKPKPPVVVKAEEGTAPKPGVIFAPAPKPKRETAPELRRRLRRERHEAKAAEERAKYEEQAFQIRAKEHLERWESSFG